MAAFFPQENDTIRTTRYDAIPTIEDTPTVQAPFPDNLSQNNTPIGVFPSFPSCFLSSIIKHNPI